MAAKKLPELPEGIERIGRTVVIHPHLRFDLHTISTLTQWVRHERESIALRIEVDDQTPPPSPALRFHMDASLLDPSRVLAVGLVHGGRSIRAGLVRGVLRGLAATQQRRLPMRVFDHLVPAQHWLDRHLVDAED